MPAPKKALSPTSRAKADKRNERDKAARAAKAAASGETKSGKKGKATTDLAVSGGGSSSSAPEFETTKKICFDLLSLGQLEIKGAWAGRREGEVLREVFGAARFVCQAA